MFDERIALDPAVDWGNRAAETTSGTNHIRFLLKPQPLRLTTDAPVGHILGKRAFRLEEPLHLFLGPDEPFVGNVGQTLDIMLRGEITDLIDLRSYLDAERGAW